MSVVTISTLGDLESLLVEEPNNHYLLDRVHIVIINLDDVSMARTGCNRIALVKKIRNQKGLTNVAIIFSERNGKRVVVSNEAKVEEL